MQCLNKKDLRLRTRYYQGLQDISFLDKGNIYLNLPESYILFICLFDLFNKKLPVYTFESTCLEDNSISLNDKTHKVFYNVNAWEKEGNPARRALLKFFYDGKVEGAHDKAVETAKIMLANNMDVSLVVKCTGLTEEEVEQIGKEH